MGMKLEAIREDRTRGGRSTYQVLSSEFVFIIVMFFLSIFHSVSLSSSCVIFSSHDDIFLVLLHNSSRLWQSLGLWRTQQQTPRHPSSPAGRQFFHGTDAHHEHGDVIICNDDLDKAD